MNKRDVTVLRLGHRFSRDARISTHIALVTRAFGADRIVFDTTDQKIEESVRKVCDEWGGDLKVENTRNWKKYVEGFQGTKIHLTMYGMNLNDKIDEIKKDKKDILIIVGGKKVPSDIYAMVDHNIAIGNQPHSEVAALAVFLDRLHEGRELDREFNGKKTIIPTPHGKKVEKRPI